MKMTYRMCAIEEELAELSYLNGNQETPQIKKLMEEYREEMQKLEQQQELEQEENY